MNIVNVNRFIEFSVLSKAADEALQISATWGRRMDQVGRVPFQCVVKGALDIKGLLRVGINVELEVVGALVVSMGHQPPSKVAIRAARKSRHSPRRS